MKNSKMFKKVGFIGMTLCALCCTLPIIWAILGVGGLAALSQYVEWAGIGALVLTLIFLGFYYLKREKPSIACDLDCDCRSQKDLNDTQKQKITL